MLSSLCVVASKFQSQLFEYANLVFDATQVLSSSCSIFFFVSAREIRYTDLHNSFMISFSLCQMKKIKTSICEVLNEGVDQDDSSKIVVLDFLTNVASHQV